MKLFPEYWAVESGRYTKGGPFDSLIARHAWNAATEQCDSHLHDVRRKHAVVVEQLRQHNLKLAEEKDRLRAIIEAAHLVLSPDCMLDEEE